MLLMRLTEIVGAIPFLPFALCLSAIFQGSDIHENTRIVIIMLILGVLSWTGLARLVRGQILAEREKEFVTAARSMGVKERRIAFRHILPNIVSVILVTVTLDFASCMLTESSLSYLGFGVQLPRPTWGNMLNGSRNALVIQSFWWRWVFPALFLSVVVICINIIGDTLRDVLDPKSEVEKWKKLYLKWKTFVLFLRRETALLRPWTMYLILFIRGGLWELWGNPAPGKVSPPWVFCGCWMPTATLQAAPSLLTGRTWPKWPHSRCTISGATGFPWFSRNPWQAWIPFSP